MSAKRTKKNSYWTASTIDAPGARTTTNLA
jgi:hypothetical protein